MKKSSFFLIVAVIVVIVVVVGAIWYYEMSPTWQGAGTGTPTSTANSVYPITYTNTTYGFNFSLPADWQGYTIVTSSWDGTNQQSCPASGCPQVTGPEISIRNPQWTQANPYQDIPIMVFTPAEWNAVATGTLAIGAAPIPPSELGSNANYVFALPARYDYAYPNGWQEVETIMASNPLKAL